MENEIKLQQKRFSKEEKQELREMLCAENKALWKRPQYIIGNVIFLGLIYYFMFRSFGVEDFSWLTTANITFALIMLLVMLFFALLFKKRAFKNSTSNAIGFGIIMSLIGIQGILIPSSKTHWNWTYFGYMLFTFIGFICNGTSIKEHFCKKIYLLKKTGSSRSHQ